MSNEVKAITKYSKKNPESDSSSAELGIQGNPKEIVTTFFKDPGKNSKLLIDSKKTFGNQK